MACYSRWTVLAELGIARYCDSFKRVNLSSKNDFPGPKSTINNFRQTLKNIAKSTHANTPPETLGESMIREFLS